jgi:hypothetical protein
VHCTSGAPVLAATPAPPHDPSSQHTSYIEEHPKDRENPAPAATAAPPTDHSLQHTNISADSTGKEDPALATTATPPTDPSAQQINNSCCAGGGGAGGGGVKTGTAKPAQIRRHDLSASPALNSRAIELISGSDPRSLGPTASATPTSRGAEPRFRRFSP